jgi:hypothetical protein
MPAKNTAIVVKNKMPYIIKGLSEKQIGALGDVIGEMLEEALVDKIHDGDSSWPPLSDAWAEFKGHDNPWYYTGTLENAIKYVREGTTIYAGIIDAGSYRNGENIATVAHKLEFGTSDIPARPLFSLVEEESEKDIVDEAVDYVKGLIKEGKV